MTVNDLIDCLLEFPGGLEVIVSTTPGEALEITCLSPDVDRSERFEEDHVTIVASGITIADQAQRPSAA